MRKTLFTLLLVLTTAFQAYAQMGNSHRNPNDPVDYNRIRIPTTEPMVPVCFTVELPGINEQGAAHVMLTGTDVGKLVASKAFNIGGNLIHTWDISPEVLEKAVQLALRESGIGTRERLREMQKDADKFMDFTYTDQQFAKDMFDFVTNIVPLNTASNVAITAGGSLVTVSNNILGQEPTFDIGGLTSTYLTSAEVLGKEHVVNDVLGKTMNYATLLKIMNEQHERDVQKWVNRAALLNLRELDYFYFLASRALRYYAEKDDLKMVWLMNIRETTFTLPTQFRGEKASVNWTFEMSAIKLRGTGMNRPFEGEYYGFFRGSASIDASNYDRNYSKVRTFGAVDEDSPLEQINQSSSAFGAGDEIRIQIAMDKNNPNIKYPKIVNDPTSVVLKYSTPVAMKVDAGAIRNPQAFDAKLNYFWDAKQYGSFELVSNEALMTAMGISSVTKDQEVKVNARIHKEYSSYDTATKEYKKFSETGGDYYYYFMDNGKSTDMPVMEFLTDCSPAITDNIPALKPHVLWGNEVKPDLRGARTIAEEMWAPLFKKYNMNF